MHSQIGQFVELWSLQHSDNPSVQGRVTGVRGSDYYIEADGGPKFTTNEKVLFNYRDDKSECWVASVIEADEYSLRLRIRKTSRERRFSPRALGGIFLKFKVESSPFSEEKQQRWISNGISDPELPWRVPDSFMNFSLSGLQFNGGDWVKKHDRILMEFGVENQQKRFRGTATVVKVSELSQESREELLTWDGVSLTHSISVNFEEVPTASLAALGEFLSTIQQALLDVGSTSFL